MNILLTGGAGYIGSHTAVALLGAGHQVVLIDNFSNSGPDVVASIKKISGQNIVVIAGDVRDTSLVEHTLHHHGIHSVIHFAGLKAVGESVRQPLDYYANNTQGTISLLQAMNANGVRSLVFSSSATVYGNPRYLPLDEDHPTSATNPYGRSKLHIEEILADLCLSDQTWAVACLRYFNPVGAHTSGLIGEDPNGIPNNLMPYIARVASGQLAEVGVFGADYPTKDGTGVRDYIHVMDLAEAHLAAVNYLTGNPGWHAINLGTGQGYSVLEMIKAFEAVSGRPVPFRVQPRRPGDIAACYAKNAKAANTLNWSASRGLNEMCASTWNFQQRLSIQD